MKQLTAAVLTLAWVISEGKGYWSRDECRTVQNPDTGEMELWDKKRVVVNRFRQFLGTVGKDFDPLEALVESVSTSPTVAPETIEKVVKGKKGKKAKRKVEETIVPTDPEL